MESIQVRAPGCRVLQGRGCRRGGRAGHLLVISGAALSGQLLLVLVLAIILTPRLVAVALRLARRENFTDVSFRLFPNTGWRWVAVSEPKFACDISMPLRRDKDSIEDGSSSGAMLETCG